MYEISRYDEVDRKFSDYKKKHNPSNLDEWYNLHGENGDSYTDNAEIPKRVKNMGRYKYNLMGETK